MAPFLGSHKTEIGDSFKQVINQKAWNMGVQKNQQEKLGSSLFQLALKKKCDMHHRHKAVMRFYTSFTQATFTQL